MAIMLTKKAAKAVVTVKQPDGSEHQKTEIVGEGKLFADPPCNVGVDKAMTVNLGNYNSVRVGVSLHVPCRHEEIDEVFGFADDWTNGKMETLVAAANASKEG